MFVKLGDLINRIWPGLLLGWIGILIVVMTLAPPLWDVVETEEFSALPATSPSLLGEQLFRAAFPKSLVPSRIVIVVRRPDEKLTEQDLDWVDDGIHDDDPERDFELRECLLKIAEDDGGLDSESNEELPAGSHRNRRSLISSVRTYRDKTLEHMVLSKDGHATLVLVELTTDFLDFQNQKIVARIQKLLLDTSAENDNFRRRIPPGIELYLSGEATVGRDMQTAARDSAKATETLTVGLVVVLLIIIYRAPLLAFIPLITVFVSVKLSMSLLILMAQHHWVILFPGVETYVTVLLYGAGVDYCLFLIDRYKEGRCGHCRQCRNGHLRNRHDDVRGIRQISAGGFCDLFWTDGRPSRVTDIYTLPVKADRAMGLLAPSPHRKSLLVRRLAPHVDDRLSVESDPLVAEYLGCGRAALAAMPDDRLVDDHFSDASVCNSRTHLFFSLKLRAAFGFTILRDERSGNEGSS